MGVYTRYSMKEWWPDEQSDACVPGEDIEAVISEYTEAHPDGPSLLERLATNAGRYCISRSEVDACGLQYEFGFASDYSGSRYDFHATCDAALAGEKVTCDHCQITRTEGDVTCQISGTAGKQRTDFFTMLKFAQSVLEGAAVARNNGASADKYIASMLTLDSQLEEMGEEPETAIESIRRLGGVHDLTREQKMQHQDARYR